MKILIPAGIFIGLIIVSCRGDSILLSEAGLSEIRQPVLRLSGVDPCEPKTTRETGSISLMDVFSREFGSLDRLKVRIQHGRVSFIHQGATLNCCMDSLGLALKREGNLFLVMETEHTVRKCECLCDYTVYGEILGLLPGACTIEVRNSAAPEHTLCAARVIIP